MNIKEMVHDYVANVQKEKQTEAEMAEAGQKPDQPKYDMRGVKTRLFDDFAKTLSRIDADFYQFPLTNNDEVMLAGFYIGRSKRTSREKVGYIKTLLPHIQDWCTCDAIISRIKGVESEKDFFISLLHSPHVFSARAGVVWLIKYALKEDLKGVVNLLKSVTNDEFYVKMAISWCYGEAFALDYNYMYKFMQDIDDEFIRNKTVQKACISYKLTDAQKEEIKKLKIESEKPEE